MSHVVTIKTQYMDPGAIAAACKRLNWPAPTQGTHDIYGTRNRATGLGTTPTGWYRPLVIDSRGGLHYETHWKDHEALDAFAQAYAVEKAKIEARKQGYSATETTLADGSIRLDIETGAAY